MFLRLYKSNNPEFAALELPMMIMPSLYDRFLVVAWGNSGDPAFAYARIAVISFRWFPALLWQHFPRAWGMRQPAPFVDATDWTGRERQLSSIVWYFDVRHWTAARLRALCEVRAVTDFEFATVHLYDSRDPAEALRVYFGRTNEDAPQGCTT